MSSEEHYSPHKSSPLRGSEVCEQLNPTVELRYRTAKGKPVYVTYVANSEEFTLAANQWDIKTIDEVVAILENAGVPYADAPEEPEGDEETITEEDLIKARDSEYERLASKQRYLKGVG